jgi:hypothetical protein
LLAKLHTRSFMVLLRVGAGHVEVVRELVNVQPPNTGLSTVTGLSMARRGGLAQGGWQNIGDPCARAALPQLIPLPL